MISERELDQEDLQGARAGLVSRVIADIIDVVTVALIFVAGYLSFCAVLFIARPRTFSFPTPGRYWSLAIAWVVVVGYLTIGWFLTGRTPGKQLAGLRVVTAAGFPLSVPKALARAILCVFFPLGLVWCAFSSKSASVQDLLLRTSVIYDWKNHAMEPVAAGAPPTS